MLTLIRQTRSSVLRTVNKVMVLTNYGIGKMIVEEEQNGKDRAGYGQQLVDALSRRLLKNLGKVSLRLTLSK